LPGNPKIDTRRFHGWFERDLRVGEITCKTLMGRSGIESVDYAINPYLGCAHACVYCYARFMRRMGHKGERWGSFVDAKVNALERLKAEVPKRMTGIVLLSSVTDPYQPLEKKYELTRGSLELLLERQFPVSILTKSDLVLRDLDLIRKFDTIEVGFTLTTIHDSARRAFEPGASPVERRLEALRELSEEGIPTWAFIGPVLPYITEDGLEFLLDELAGCVNRVLIDRLNVKSGNMPDIRRALKVHYPDLQPLFESALKGDSVYYDGFRRKASEMCRRRSIPFEVLY
jgi:DNA repair photolyase